MNLIEQLNDLCTEYEGGALALSVVTDLRAIIEQAKREAVEPVAYEVYFPDEPRVEYCNDLDELVDALTNERHEITPLYAAPQPDHTKLIGELVNALERAEKCLVNSCMSHRNKVYPKPVDRVRVANHCNRVITKAREAIK